VDPHKIAEVGRMTALALMALASDPAYQGQGRFARMGGLVV
jgi:hypothetical protein